MPTRQDLITATLEKLNAIGAGQAPEAEDVEAVDKFVDGKLKDLNKRGIVWLPDTDEIEDEYIDPLAIILASMAAPSFGQASKPDSVLLAENNLRELRNSDRTAVDVTPSQYF